MNWSGEVAVPPGVVTDTLTEPLPAGEVAVSEVVVTLEKVAVVVPKCTAVTPIRLVPVTVTEVPPAAGPPVGLIPVTVGAGT